MAEGAKKGPALSEMSSPSTVILSSEVQSLGSFALSSGVDGRRTSGHTIVSKSACGGANLLVLADFGGSSALFGEKRPHFVVLTFISVAG